MLDPSRPIADRRPGARYGADHRSVSNPRSTGQRRHGRGVPRRGSAPRSEGCAQTTIRRVAERAGRPGAPAPRGARRGAADPPQHRGHLRRPRSRRPSLHRHGVRAGRVAGRQTPARSASDRPGGGDREPTRRRAGRRARARRRAPRPQAGQRHADAQRLRQDPRLRPRQDPRAHARRAGPQRPREPRRRRPVRRHAGLQRARAVLRRAGRSAQRPVQPRRPAVRDRDGLGGLRRIRHDGDRAGHDQPDAAALDRAPPRGATRPRPDCEPAPREGPATTARVGGGRLRGPRPPSARP